MRRGAWAVLILCSAATATAQNFSRPTACSDCIGNWYYFDRNSGDGATEDWNCGTSTYDGHRGSDFSLIGNNGAIDSGYDVVAVADGVVESAQDGFYDHCTGCGGAMCGTSFGYGYGNHVVINHGSYKVIYAHMRRGSIRVARDEPVSCGQVIGQIGSSGCSSGAHVHIETRPRGGAYTTAFDPFAGCGRSMSLWADQGPYRGLPGATCGSPPPPTCPSGTYPIWTCSTDRSERVRCIDGEVMREPCSAGCVSMPTGTDDVCAAPSCTYGSRWVCEGSDRVRCVGDTEERQACPMGCMDGGDTDAICRSGPVDVDGDGFDSSVDCDDADPTVHPGANDLCGDGVDANCDGVDACGARDAAAGFDGGADATADTGVAVRDAAGRPEVREAVGGCGCSTAAPKDAFVALAAWLLFIRRRSATV